MVRYAFEYQYLSFSRVAEPMTYFLSSTWFAAEYLQTGVVSESDFAELLRQIAALCATQEIDGAAIRISAAPPA